MMPRTAGAVDSRPAMALHPLAGRPAPPELLVNVPRLVTEYYVRRPDPDDPGERVAFGTSGHRGSSLRGSFNEAHILAASQAVVEERRAQGVTGPLFLAIDTHALSEPAFASALEVLDKDALFRKQFGNLFVSYYIQLKRSELARFKAWIDKNRASADEPTAWEQNEYFDFF